MSKDRREKALKDLFKKSGLESKEAQYRFFLSQYKNATVITSDAKSSSIPPSICEKFQVIRIPSDKKISPENTPQMQEEQNPSDSFLSNTDKAILQQEQGISKVDYSSQGNSESDIKKNKTFIDSLHEAEQSLKYSNNRIKRLLEKQCIENIEHFWNQSDLMLKISDRKMEIWQEAVHLSPSELEIFHNATKKIRCSSVENFFAVQQERKYANQNMWKYLKITDREKIDLIQDGLKKFFSATMDGWDTTQEYQDKDRDKALFKVMHYLDDIAAGRLTKKLSQEEYDKEDYKELVVAGFRIKSKFSLEHVVVNKDLESNHDDILYASATDNSNDIDQVQNSSSTYQSDVLGDDTLE